MLGTNAAADFGADVTLDGGLVMQTLDTWKVFIRTNSDVLSHKAGVLILEKRIGWVKHIIVVLNY